MAPPENAIRKAKDFLDLGKKRQALETLHEALLERRTKTWQKPFEELMLRFVDLCMMLQDYRILKDGLHQYRNFSQMTAPGSLEKVVIYVIDEAEKKVIAAKNRAERFNVDQDLDGESAVLGIMLSTMTEEDDKARSDRKLIVPWLKLLFESYRAVLDILKTNTKLESAYHQTATRAFDFCFEFKRISEFRKLCETLRNHLTKLTKVQSDDKKPRGWEGWTIGSVELHLETRFKRLDVAMQLDLWTEAFRTVEEINSICLIKDKELKKKYMAKYYEKLTKVFWASDNLLFHSYSWLKYHTINREYNKNTTNEDKVHQSSIALLSALCIPTIFQDERTSRVFAEDDTTAQKTSNLTILIGLNTSPSRKNLIAELVNENIIPQALPEIQQLYEKIEVEFLSLNLVHQIQPNLNFIASHPDLSIYLPALEKVIVLKILKQLSKVYKTLKISQFNDMIEGLKMSTEKVENIIVRASQHSLIQVRIDHASQVLRFGNLHLESDFIRNQLCMLGTNLHRASELIIPREETENKQRAALFRLVRNNLQDEWERNRSRPSLVERRRTEIEKKQEDKIKHQEKKKEIDIASERERQQKDEELKKIQAEEQKKESEEVHKCMEILARYGKQVPEAKIKRMKEEERKELENNTKKEFEMAKAKEEERIARIIVRLESMVRSFRRAEVPLLLEHYQKLCQEDESKYMKFRQEIISNSQKQYEDACAFQKVFEPALHLKSEFVDKVMEARRLLWQEECAKHIAKAKEEAKARKLERARKRKDQALKQAEEDRKRKEEDRKRQVEEDRKRQEEEKLRKAEEDKLKKEEERIKKFEETTKHTVTQTIESDRYVPPQRNRENKTVPEQQQQQQQQQQPPVVPTAAAPSSTSSRFGHLKSDSTQTFDKTRRGTDRNDGTSFHDKDQGRFAGNRFPRDGDRDQGRSGATSFSRDGDRDQGRSGGFQSQRDRDQGRPGGSSFSRDGDRDQGRFGGSSFSRDNDQKRQTSGGYPNRGQEFNRESDSNREHSQGKGDFFNKRRNEQTTRNDSTPSNDKARFSALKK